MLARVWARPNPAVKVGSVRPVGEIRRITRPSRSPRASTPRRNSPREGLQHGDLRIRSSGRDGGAAATPPPGGVPKGD
jgi:hypothetical protein